MLQRFKSYFVRLENLSGEDLDRSAEKLVGAEKRSAAKLIAHLSEMSRRKVALELGYKGLFDYCVRRLRLSEGSVALRIQVANVARKFPEILVALAQNRMSLTVAGLIAPHLTAENVEKVLADCEGKSKRQTEEYLVAIRPKPVFKPSIRKQPKKAPPPQSPRVEAPPSPPTAPPPPAAKPILQPAEPDIFNFRFAAGRSFKEKFERFAEVLGVEAAQKHMAEILEEALDIAIDKKDPKKKAERRAAREAKKNAAEASPRPDEVSSGEPDHVTSALKERVFARAGYQCEYEWRDGTRCSSRTGLQIEHTRPYGVFHSHDERFLKAFCPAHNRLAAEKFYGVEFIRQKIEESRQQRAPNVAADASAPRPSSAPG